MKYLKLQRVGLDSHVGHLQVLHQIHFTNNMKYASGRSRINVKVNGASVS